VDSHLLGQLICCSINLINSNTLNMNIRSVLTVAALALSTFGAMAQGTFKVQASSTAQAVTYAPDSGRTGNILTADGAWQVEVLVSGTSRFSGALTLAGTSGRINNSSTIVSLASNFANDSVPVVVRVWYGAATYALAQSTAGAFFGSSASFTQTLGGTPNGGGAALPDPGMVNMLAFTVTTVPEPSVIALGVLGLGALALRRKTA
jgi:hypothetical protein